jgi:hypothetical protein
MGIFFLLAWFTATVKFHTQGSNLWILSLVLGLLNLWSLGILWNWRAGRPTPKIGRQLHMLTSALSIVFVVVALVR